MALTYTLDMKPFLSCSPPHIFLAACLAAGRVLAAGDVSEQDYLGEMPVVLSVTRLAQPLNETPAAVTVLDRDQIRRSGARDLAELLRLVPGFIFTHIEGAARPTASYHADYDSITRHLDVYVDGRSVYSSLLVGTASQGMMGIVLEDIERIEVLRGSNSAAYGANAFLGVVNVVTRHAADTLGGMVSISAGQGNVRDGVVRVGWGDPRAAFRLTAASQSDTGFKNLADSKKLQQVHFRGDLQLSSRDELTLTAGHAASLWQSDTEFGIMDQHWRNSNARAEWTRTLDSAAQFKFSATADEETYRDFYPLMRADGVSRRMVLEATHSFVANEAWRFVWGAHYRHEQVHSVDLFAEHPDQSFESWRLFGNAEWKPHAQWLVNMGGLWERHSIIGSQSAPRVVVNFLAAPGHTFRFGTTSAYKLPTLFELRTSWRYEGEPIIEARGGARSERIDTTEVGYLGQLHPTLSLDFRGFVEKVKGLLRYSRPCRSCGNDVINKDANTQRGWEGQLRWQPSPDTQVLLNHTELRLVPDATSTARNTDPYRAPRHFSSLALFQRLPENFDLSLIHTTTQSYFWVRKDDMLPAFRQTDLRLAKNFRVGTARAEAAIFLRAIGGGHVDYVQRGLPEVYLDRRLHASLRLDF